MIPTSPPPDIVRYHIYRQCLKNQINCLTSQGWSQEPHPAVELSLKFGRWRNARHSIYSYLIQPITDYWADKSWLWHLIIGQRLLQPICSNIGNENRGQQEINPIYFIFQVTGQLDSGVEPGWHEQSEHDNSDRYFCESTLQYILIAQAS